MRTFFFLVLLLIPAQAYAQNRLPQLSTELSYSIAHYMYQEEGGEFMKTSGTVSGPTVKVTYLNKLTQFMAEVSAQYLFGSGTYEGGLVNTFTGERRSYSHDGDEYKLIVGQVLLGRDYKINKKYDDLGRERTKFYVTPFFGVGLRHLNNDSNDPYAYRRRTTWVYLPVGTELTWRLTPKLRVGFRPQANLLVYGKIRSDLFDDSPFRNKLGFGDGYGFSGSVPVKRTFDSFALSLEPFVRYWNVKESDRDSVITTDYVPGEYWEISALEPENETLTYGFALSFAF